jgi:hypothetical protein
MLIFWLFLSLIGKVNEISTKGAKASGSLTFSSSNLGDTKSKLLAKRKEREGEEDDWEDLVKKAKVDREAIKKDPRKPEAKTKQQNSAGGSTTKPQGSAIKKADKAKEDKRKDKKDQKKPKQGPLSFDD